MNPVPPPPPPAVQAAPPAPSEPRYAGFWIRLAASLIDSILVMILLAVLLRLVVGSPDPADLEVMMGDPQALTLEPGRGLELLMNLLPAVLTVVLWVWVGGTPGKRLLSCRVVRAADAGPLGWGRSVGRYLAYFVSILTFGLGFLWIAFDRRKQGFHDKLAGTLVIYDEPHRQSLAELEDSLK